MSLGDFHVCQIGLNRGAEWMPTFFITLQVVCALAVRDAISRHETCAAEAKAGRINSYVENIKYYGPELTFATEAICRCHICGAWRVLFGSACEQLRRCDTGHYQVSVQYR